MRATMSESRMLFPIRSATVRTSSSAAPRLAQGIPQEVAEKVAVGKTGEAVEVR